MTTGEGPHGRPQRHAPGMDSWRRAMAHPSVQGYGPRDPPEQDVPRDLWERGRLRARASFVVGGVVLGAFLIAPFVFAAAIGPDGAFGRALARGPEYFAAGVGLVVLGVRYLVVPVVAWDPEGMTLQHRPWPTPVRVSLQDVVWRQGARYVGRYLLVDPAEGKPVRFPLWMISRSGARRLFAYLDHRPPATP